MNEEKRLMRQIQIYSFAVYEAVLYLDSYPDDKRALAYYNKKRARLDELRSHYEKRYGPLTPYDNEGDDWKWTANAWPWEYGSN